MRHAALAHGHHWAVACSGLATDARAQLLRGVCAAGPPGHLAATACTSRESIASAARAPPCHQSTSGSPVCTGRSFASSVVPGAYLANGGACATTRRCFASSVVSFPLAQTGEGISECELIQWFTKEGDIIAEFDRLCEVQSDKATIEITSRYAGRVLKLHHAQGAIVMVGAPLVDIEVAGGAADEAEAAVVAPSASPAASPASPTELPASPSLSQAPPRPPLTASEADSPFECVSASPAVRRLAREERVELGQVRGSGEGGRVLKQDVEAAAWARDAAAAAAAPHNARAEAPAAPTAPAAAAARAAEALATAAAPPITPLAPGASATVPLRGFRRAMVKSMTAAATVPHFHYTDEVCVDALLGVRVALASDPSLSGKAKLTLLPLLVKALSVALFLSPAGDALLLHADHNIGVAMATPTGLVVPNIKRVQDLSVAQIASEIARLQAAAASNSLATADVSGGTLTVSNIGSIGGLFAAPLVNAPEVAIVAIGRMQTLPRFDATGSVVARSLLPVSWGADHRVVDGAALARLCNSWKELLEQPSKLLLQLR
ncbi:hypothetical protein FOA52_008121 [Chlamydomonas sp. UWO 241]|nr:hypothetical protein FOA52_008121 [Chlamydomonas sp. UWO 241]